MTARIVFATCIALLLGGCISIGGGSKNEQPDTVYTLHPPKADVVPPAAHAAAIVISSPDLPTGFASDRIALTYENGSKMDYYAGVKWSAPLDALLRDFLTRTARRDLHGMIVTEPEAASSPQFRLDVKFTDFGPVYAGATDAPPALAVAMTVTLMAEPSGTARSQFSVRKTSTASANSVTAITQGLETLLQSAADEALGRVATAVHSPEPAGTARRNSPAK